MSIVSNVIGGLETAYNLYADWTNRKYKQNLQQTIFEREDNALQRRMADAQAAGLNPFSVATGAGAGAGAVVNADLSRQNFGSYLDYRSKQQMVKQQEAQTKAVNISNKFAENMSKLNLEILQEHLKQEINKTKNTDLDMYKHIAQHNYDMSQLAYLLGGSFTPSTTVNGIPFYGSFKLQDDWDNYSNTPAGKQQEWLYNKGMWDNLGYEYEYEKKNQEVVLNWFKPLIPILSLIMSSKF